MTIKFRYKEPNGTASKLITKILHDNAVMKISATDDDFRFACAVAEFGMVLRDSEHKGLSDFKTLIELAKHAKGSDEDGYRAEFIRLAEMAELLKLKNPVAEKD
jgi:Ca-activated chloride channel family protein